MSDQVYLGLIGLIGTCVATTPAIISARASKRAERTAKVIHEEVRSTNGRPTGEYVMSMSATLDGLKESQEAMFDLLILHTQDPSAHWDSAPLGDGVDQQRPAVRASRVTTGEGRNPVQTG